MTRKGRALLAQGSQAFLASDFPQALNTWEKAFDLFVATNDAEGLQLASENLGMAHYHLGHYAEVIRLAEFSLEISNKRDDHDGLSRALTLLGGAYAKLGDAARAVTAHEESLRLARTINDQEGIIRATGNAAEALMVCGRYAEALEHAQSALGLLNGRGVIQDRFYVRCENLLGAIYRNIGEHDLADQAFDRALQRARDADDRHGESAALINRSHWPHLAETVV